MKICRKTQFSETKFLASVIEDNTPLRGRIALLTLSTENSSRVVDQIILFMEYSQCFCVFFLTNYKLYGEPSSEPVHISTIFNIIFKLFSPASLIPFQDSSKDLIVSIAVALIGAFLIRLIIFGYITLNAFKKERPSKYLEIAWKMVFWLQTRVVYFIMGSIWMNFFEAINKDQVHFEHSKKSAFLAICTLMFLAEFLFSLFLQTQFSSIIPSKSLLSCKDIKIETITLVQKASNQFIRRVFASSPYLVIWFVCLFGTLLSIIRLRLFVYYLSPYQLKSLFYQMFFLVAILALNIACLTQAILHESSPIDMDCVTILWIVLTVLFVKVANDYLKNRILKLLISKPKDCPEALVHKVIITKDIMKNIKSSSNNSWDSLLLTTLNQNMLKSFGFTDGNLTFNSSKQERNKLFSLYLESLLQKYPRNDFLRLYTAHHYAKREKLYGLCLKTLANLRSSTSWKIIVSRSVLFHQMVNTISSDYKNQLFKFDISEYAESTLALAQIKVNMKEQASLQIQICQEILGESPNLTNIAHLGQRAVDFRKKIEIQKRKFSEKAPDYYLEPHLVFGHYYLSVNHAYGNNILENSLYNKRRLKYDKLIASKKFCQENLYRGDVCQLIFSAEREIEGLILYCGGNYQEILGRDLKGSHLSMSVPPTTRTSPQLFVKAILKEDASSFVGKLQNRYFYNSQDETISEVSYYADIIPFMSQGLAYYAILKPARYAREAILITKDGTIESFTKNIGKKLNLFAMKHSHLSEEKQNIGLICPELSRVNETFNAVSDSTKLPNTNKSIVSNSTSPPEKAKSHAAKTKHFLLPNYESYELQARSSKADEIFNLYTGEGKTLYFQSFREGTKGTQILGRYPYHCTISLVRNNSNGSKFIILEREKGDEISCRESIKVDSARGTTLIKQDFIKLPEPTLEDVEASEKETGWIDLQKLKTEPNNPHELQLPPSSHRLTLISPRRITTERDRLFSSEVETPREIPLSTEDGNNTKPQLLQDNKSFSIMLTNRESVFSLNSQGSVSNKVRLEKVFEQAVISKFNPLYFQLYILAFYLFFIALFTIQAKMSSKISAGFDSLEASKEVLLIAESRNSYLININGGVYYLLGHASGFFSLSDLGAGLGVAYFAETIGVAVFALKDANLNLLVTANSLTANERDILFANNVRVFDTFFDVPVQTWTNLTNFQACNQMIETTLKAINVALDSPTDAVPYLQFAARNLMNDILIKDSEIADTFHQSLQDRKQSFIDTITISFVALTVVVIFSACLYFYIIYSQYRKERTNLSAYTKLNKTAVKLVLNNLMAFRTLIDQNKSLEKLLKDKAIPNYVTDPNSGFENRIAKEYDEAGNPLANSKGLGKMYIWVSFRLLIVAVIMCALFACYFVKLKTAFQKVGVKAAQLYAVDKLNARVALTRSSLFELPVTNNTGLIRNMQVSASITQGIAQVNLMQQELIENFENDDDDSAEIKAVREIMFNDACGAMKATPTAYNYCEKLINYQEKQGLVSVTNAVGSLFKNYFNQYMNSDKSASTLKALGIWAFKNITSPVYWGFQALLAVISATLDASFSEAIQAGKDVNNSLIKLILVALVFAALIAHIFVVNPLRSREGRFKQMLILFPANVVLSNYILKSYLKKVSKGSFDSVRYEV